MYGVLVRAPGMAQGLRYSSESSLDDARETIQEIAPSFPEGTFIYIVGRSSVLSGKNVFRVDSEGKAVRSSWVYPWDEPASKAALQARSDYLDERLEEAVGPGSSKRVIKCSRFMDTLKRVEALEKGGRPSFKYLVGSHFVSKAMSQEEAQEFNRKVEALEQDIPPFMGWLEGSKELRLGDVDFDSAESLSEVPRVVRGAHSDLLREKLEEYASKVEDAVPEIKTFQGWR